MDLTHLPTPTPRPVDVRHKAAEAALLASAVVFGRAQARMRENTSHMAARSEAASAHAHLNAAAKAYAAAHAELVAAS